MMTATEIATFLASIRLETHAARYMRAVVYRAHTGRWPAWRAHAMQRSGNAIVELGELRNVRVGARYAVITWRLDEISMRMLPCETMREALLKSARMFRIDLTRAEVRG